MATTISFDVQKRIGYLTFSEDVEKRPCTLDGSTLDSMNKHLDYVFAQQEGIAALVIQSNSPKYFIVGANIKAVQQLTPDNITDWVRKGHQTFNRLQQLPIPVIAKVGGFALGGGLELAMACDIIIAGEQAKFGQPEASLGVMPGWGGSFRLAQRVGVAKAKELFFTGKIIGAKEALAVGLVERVAGDAELEAVLDEMLEAIKSNDAKALGYIKQIINHAFNGEIVRNCDDEAATSVICLSSTETQKTIGELFLKP